ncbi:ATP-binding protein [Streptomyces ochraceiscleroticus]|uniref:ATP-binding protein n=1 Tax=Streptomyces ochraceiscleroticus TaxID=47761 RepID=A0ABW1ML29_9ACTN|nr:NB-ARC domain-containing protein [Streptomyces ochraceiscleroticus]
MLRERGHGPAGLIGRDGALSEVAEVLRAERLVTVSGPGGVGKTALVAELAHRLLPGQWEAVGWVDLVRLDGLELLPQRLARALGRGGLPARGTSEALADALGGAPALLVVDTCEYVADACAEILTGLVAACPGLHVLATSRTPMDTSGHYRLRPLPLEEAARLFEASGRRWDFVDVPTAKTAEHICAFLDGLPLAVHIAAGQLAHHSPNEVLSLVSRADTLLDLTIPGLPARQRTLRESLLSTHQLCTREEQLLWARCTVFPGPFGLRDALEVCADDRLPPEALVAAFAGLGRRALILPQEPHGATYRMPWSTRAHGRQWLNQLGEEREFLQRCLTWLLRDS